MSMTEDWKREPRERVMNAIEKLLKKDKYLLRADVNERSITHRLGMYLQDEFPDYDVDCEYNRNGIDPKRIGYPETTETNDSEGRTVFPDIIVHKRGNNDSNYLVVEVKKSNSKVKSEIDREKLWEYKKHNGLNYEFALFLIIEVGDKPGITSVEWIT